MRALPGFCCGSQTPRRDGALRPHEVRGRRRDEVEADPRHEEVFGGCAFAPGQGAFFKQDAPDLGPAFPEIGALEEVVGPLHMDGKAHAGKGFGDEAAHGGGGGGSRERVDFRQAQRRVDVAFGGNPVPPELAASAPLAEGQHAAPDGKLPGGREPAGDIHT